MFQVRTKDAMRCAEKRVPKHSIKRGAFRGGTAYHPGRVKITARQWAQDFDLMGEIRG
jgi:hypothetical protein